MSDLAFVVGGIAIALLLAVLLRNWLDGRKRRHLERQRAFANATRPTFPYGTYGTSMPWPVPRPSNQTETMEGKGL
jgi:hypothetical protein